MNQDVLSRAMKSMAARIKHYQAKLPTNGNGDDQEIDDAVDAILAIEGEWLVNMDQRRASQSLKDGRRRQTQMSKPTTSHLFICV